MIKTIELHNFKNHLDTKIALDGSCLHALVGPNSSGKTTVLQALDYLSQLTKQPANEFFSEERDGKHLITFGKTKSRVSTCLDLEESNTEWSAAYELEKTGENSIEPKLSWKDDKWHTGPYHPQIINILKHTVFLKLSAEKLAQAAYSEEIAPEIGSDGSGLAPALDFLKYEAPEKFDDLQKNLKRIVPGVREVGIRRAKVSVVERRSIGIDEKSLPFEDSKEMTGQEIIFNMDSGKRIPAHAMSEGTIITLGLLAMLMSPNRPTLLLLDDIAQGLHPKAQAELIQVLKKIIQTNPGLQIIFTTHSPYIIDELEPSQVHVLNTTPKGYAVVRRMDEHPGVQRGLEVLTTGEFWDAEGEEWILAGETSG